MAWQSRRAVGYRQHDSVHADLMKPRITNNLLQHPDDRRALERVRVIAGPLAKVLTIPLDLHAKQEAFKLQGTALRVGEQALPRLWAIHNRAARTLELDQVPPLYAIAGPLNAYTTGYQHPLVAISSEALVELADDEASFVLGHELGHYRCGHCGFHTMAQMIAVQGTKLCGAVIPGLSTAASLALTPALSAFGRRSEFTADRAGAIACGSIESSIRALAKLAGFPYRGGHTIDPLALIQQGLDFESSMDASVLNTLSVTKSLLTASHPFTCLRALELKRWEDAGGLEDITAPVNPQLAAKQPLWNSKKLAEFADPIHSTLANWLHKKTGQSLKSARRSVVSWLGGLSPQLRVGDLEVCGLELTTEKASANQLSTKLNAYSNVDGKVIKTVFQIAAAMAWDEAPAELRTWFTQQPSAALRTTLLPIVR